jgi:coenzyme F420-0:L-glutamate ligase/coenzyme F420-1:gamma-L-glutamate ligase
MTLEILAVQGIPEVTRGDDLTGLIVEHAPGLRDGDVLVVTSKIVSKAEGQLHDIDRDVAIDAETVRVVARRGETRIVQTRHGFVLAAAGVDASNVTKGQVVVLPADSDESARRIRDGVRHRLGVNVGVVISDTFGRPWRVGVTDVAVGLAGLDAFDDLRGTVDPYGNELQVTLTCTVDEIASAADLVKGKLKGVPVAIVRGLAVVHDVQMPTAQGISQVIRSADDDMFSLGSRDVLRARLDVSHFTDDPVDADLVTRALGAAELAARPPGWSKLRFAVVDSAEAKRLLAAAIGDETAATAPLVVVPYLVDAPTAGDLLASGAAIENVLVALAVERLGSRWLAPADALASEGLAGVSGVEVMAYALGAIAVGRPAPTLASPR